MKILLYSRKTRLIRSGYRPRLELLEPRTVLSFLPAVPYTTGMYPVQPDVADFNLDGKLDVAVPTCQNSRISVFLGNGDGTLAPHKQYPVRAVCPSSVETADMNNDGVPDLEAANDISGGVSVLLGVGD